MTADTALGDRVWDRVDATGDCWEWTGSLDRDGYAERIWVDGVRHRPHRLIYELLVGEIPDGLQLDHLCRNRACVNPDHCRVVTLAENVLAGFGITANNARKMRCKRGHLFDEANTSYKASGSRRCKTCHRQREYEPNKRRREGQAT